MNIILMQADEIISGRFILRRQDARFIHIKKILKYTTGDSFKAGIINGAKGTATITRCAEEYFEGVFVPQEDSMPLPPVQLILGFPRPIQLRRILRDIAGLGIAKLFLTGTDLGEKSYMAADIASVPEITRLLTDGCCQAGETLIPAVSIFQTVDHVFTENTAWEAYHGIKAVLDVPQRIYQADSAIDTRLQTGADTAAHTASVTPQWGFSAASPLEQPACSYPLSMLKPAAGQPVLLAIGSERGWSGRERQLFAAKGFTVYTMGSRILRTETAAAAALAVCLSNAGWWG